MHLAIQNAPITMHLARCFGWVLGDFAIQTIFFESDRAYPSDSTTKLSRWTTSA